MKSGCPTRFVEYDSGTNPEAGIYKGTFVCVTKSTEPVLNFSILIFFGSV
jgi:hypothetical protein